MEATRKTIEKLKLSNSDQEIENLLDKYFVSRKAEEITDYAKKYSQETINFDSRIDWNSIDMRKLNEQYARVIRN